MTDNSTRNKEVLKLKIFLKLASLMSSKQLDEEKSKKLGLELPTTKVLTVNNSN
jgi:hypothetical protein